MGGAALGNHIGCGDQIVVPFALFDSGKEGATEGFAQLVGIGGGLVELGVGVGVDQGKLVEEFAHFGVGHDHVVNLLVEQYTGGSFGVQCFE